MKKLLLSCILLISSVSVFAQTTCANATNITSNGTKTCPAITGTYSNPCLGGTTNDAGTAMKAIWFKYTPASNGEITISSDLPVNDGATNSDDTRLSVFSGVCATLTCIDYNDDVDDANYLSSLTVPVAAGTTYYIQWDNYWSALKFSFTFEFVAQDCVRPGVGDFYSPDSYTTTSVNLYWDPSIGAPANYDVDWSTDFNAAAGTGTIVSVPAGSLEYVPATISGLPASSNFRYYVRANCGATQSEYQGPFAGYLAKILPYTTDFEDNGRDGFRFFSLFDTTQYDAPLDTYADGGAGTALYTFNSTTETSDEWGYSRAISLKAGEQVTIKFKTRLYSETAPSEMKLELKVGDDQSSIAQTTLIDTFTLTEDLFYTDNSASWTAPADGTYHFGFHNNSDAGETDTILFLDTIELTSVLSTNEFVANKFTVSPNPTKDLLSISSANNLISTIAIKDLNGRVVMQKGFNKVSQAQVNVAELATGVYMMNVTSDAGSFTKKIIKQ
jgi:hypothetical protein